MAFKIGQKVVCIADSDAPASIIQAFCCHNVRKGDILIVRRIVEYSIVEYSGQGLMFEGINNPVNLVWGDEWAYVSDRFRPLVSTEDDLELFNHLLNPSLVDKPDLLAERMNELATD